LASSAELRDNGVVKNVPDARQAPVADRDAPARTRERAARQAPVARRGAPAATGERVARSGPVADRDAPAGTRERVARSVLENGPSTAAALAMRLGLTPAAVRRHLDGLLADGMLEAREPRSYGHRGRGRPAKVFALTDAGRDAFYQAYDDLAVGALRFLAQTGGEAAVSAFARTRVAELEERYRPRLAAARAQDRATVLAEALSQDGYAATVHSTPGPGGQQLCQHHCPVAHVAEQFPQLCEAETEAFARLLGTHVQRLATIAHGDGICTTYIPARRPVSATTNPPKRTFA
jgi:predicted ArsR family transcriptional regulator